MWESEGRSGSFLKEVKLFRMEMENMGNTLLYKEVMIKAMTRYLVDL